MSYLGRGSGLCAMHPEKKSHRLLRNRDFQAVYNKGRFFTSPDLVLYCHPSTYGSPSRMGYSVAKKVGTIVKRNRIKRLLREISRHNASLLPSQGYDFILLARQSAQGKGYSELEESYQALLVRLLTWMKVKR